MSMTNYTYTYMYVDAWIEFETSDGTGLKVRYEDVICITQNKVVIRTG